MAVGATARDARLDQCGVDRSAKVRLAIDLPRTAAYRAHRPKAPDLPELDAADDGPAFMAVFDGPLEIPFVGTTGFVPRTYSGALCVLVDGAPNIHAELDATGLTL